MGERVKLKDVCQILNGYTFKSEKYVDEGIRVIRITNVQKGYVEDEKPQFYPEDESETIKDYLLKEDDLLISLTGNVGRVALLRKEFLPAALNQRVACLRENTEVIRKKYLYYILLSNKFENECITSAKGIAQKNMSTEWLKEYEIPLVSLEEQDRIIKIFDATSQLINNRVIQVKDLDTLIKARFVEMFGDLKHNSKGWNILGFNDVAKIDTNMIHDFIGYEDYPHIGIDSIEKETGRLTGYRTVSEDGVISGKYLFTSEHIIYSKIRPNLNKVALPDFHGVCSADAYPILVNTDICDKYFLAYTMRSKMFLDYILAFSNRTNLPKVNKQQVEGFRCPIPPIGLQKEFADFVIQVDKLKVIRIKGGAV